MMKRVHICKGFGDEDEPFLFKKMMSLGQDVGVACGDIWFFVGKSRHIVNSWDGWVFFKTVLSRGLYQVRLLLLEMVERWIF